MATSFTVAVSAILLLLVWDPSRSGTKAQDTDICFQYDVDGCSVPFNLTFFFRTLFTQSCNRHDICYGCGVAYNISRNICDTSLKNDTMTACRNKYLGRTSMVSTSSMDHQTLNKRKVLRILAKNYKNFQSVINKPIRNCIELSETVGKYEAIHQLIHRKEHVITQWAVILSQLLYQFNIHASPIQHDTVLKFSAESNVKLKQTETIIYKEARYNKQNKEFFFPFLRKSPINYYNNPKAIFKIQPEIVANTDAQERRDGTELCVKVLNKMDSTNTLEGKQISLSCSEVQLLVCYFFSEVYYVAVALFGGSSYHDKPEFYCYQSFVPQCLPYIHKYYGDIMVAVVGDRVV